MNIVTILIALGGAGLIAFYQVKQCQNFFKFIDDYKAQHHVEVLSTGRTQVDMTSLVVALLLLVILSVRAFQQPDSAVPPQNFLLMAGVLAIIFGSSAFASRMNRQIFYTQTEFFLKDCVIPFDQIQGFERSPKGQLLRLKDDSTYVVTPQQILGLNELRRQGFFELEEEEE